MLEVIALGAGIVLVHELLRLILDRTAWKQVVFPKIRAKVLGIRFFAILTFPLVLFIYLVAASWLLPYLLLSKIHQAHLQKMTHSRSEPDWQGANLSAQLSSLKVLAFLALPFKPIFAFMEFLGKRKRTPWASHAATQKSHSV